MAEGIERPDLVETLFDGDQKYRVSREYKLMLKVSSFGEFLGDEAFRASGARKFLTEFASISRNIFNVDYPDANINVDSLESRQRSIWFVDTPDFKIRKSRYVLRVRQEDLVDGPRYDITLKYRDADRYISESKALLEFEDRFGYKLKFEEDIVPHLGNGPRFRSQYSHSVSIDKDSSPTYENLLNVYEDFPFLRNDINLDENENITRVNGIARTELRLGIPEIKLQDQPDVKSSLTFWFEHAEPDAKLLIAEFSFGFRRKKRDKFVPLDLLRSANQLFASFRERLEWIDLTADTKTASVYRA